MPAERSEAIAQPLIAADDSMPGSRYSILATGYWLLLRFLSHLFCTVRDMNTVMLRSACKADISPPAVVEAIALLADLGAEVVDRCQNHCEICGHAWDAAA